MSSYGERRSTSLDLFYNWSSLESTIYCIFSFQMRFADLYRMVIVMTMNVGYFFAVLAGIFVGELGFGRLISSGHARTATGANVESSTGTQ